MCCVQSLSLCPTLLQPPGQAPLSMRFSRQEYWSRLSCPPLGDLPNSGIEPMSLTSPALAGGFFATSANLTALNNTDLLFYSFYGSRDWHGLAGSSSPLWASQVDQCRRHGDPGSVLESGRSPGGGHGSPLQYSCLENAMDRGA